MADCRKSIFTGLATVAVVVTGFACGGEEANQPPVPEGVMPVFTVDAGATTTRRVRQFFKDPDGDELTYEASSDDQSVATTSMDGPDVTVEGKAVGTATITVTATDPDGESALQEADVIVSQPNRPPTVGLPIPDLDITVNQVVDISLLETFIDPDGDVLTYDITIGDESVATATIDGMTLTITGVGAGTTSISITATDPDGESATDEFTVTVT